VEELEVNKRNQLLPKADSNLIICNLSGYNIRANIIDSIFEGVRLHENQQEQAIEASPLYKVAPFDPYKGEEVYLKPGEPQFLKNRLQLSELRLTLFDTEACYSGEKTLSTPGVERTIIYKYKDIVNNHITITKEGDITCEYLKGNRYGTSIINQSNNLVIADLRLNGLLFTRQNDALIRQVRPRLDQRVIKILGEQDPQDPRDDDIEKLLPIPTLYDVYFYSIAQTLEPRNVPNVTRFDYTSIGLSFIIRVQQGGPMKRRYNNPIKTIRTMVMRKDKVMLIYNKPDSDEIDIRFIDRNKILLV